jgi:hypothetical protein
MSAYTDRVDRNLAGLEFVSVGLCPSCPYCQSAYGMSPREFYAAYHTGDVCDEGGFSWSGCGICGSTLGGARYSWHARDADEALFHADDACADCLMFLANGEEPDNDSGM